MSAPRVKPINIVLDRLDAVRPTSTGWKARCPAHDDHNPSLSIGLGDEDQVLIHCHAGCELEDVVQAIGLELKDLWPETAEQTRPRLVRTVAEKRYPIRDREGALYAYHVRIEKSDGGKTFRWLQPDERTWSLNGHNVTDLPLYGTDDLPTTTNIIVTEGEKAADALRSIGIRAVATVTGASSTPGETALEPLLQYKAVYLWPDHDREGIEHMRRVAARLSEMGCTNVLRLGWGDAPPKGDAADFVAAGHVKADVLELANAAREWEEEAPEPEIEHAPRFRLIPFEEYKNRTPPPQLVRGVLAKESTAMVFGESGAYKSFLALDLALHIANGIDWFGYPVEQGHVIYVAGEGAAGMMKRIRAWEIYHGCGVGNAWMLSDAVQLPDPKEIDSVLEAIEAAQAEPVLIVIDTLAKSSTGLDENTQKDMNMLISGAERLQRATGAVPLMVHHTNRQGLYRGSSVIKASMDTMLEMKAEDDQPILSSYKQKDLEAFPPIHMGLERIEVKPAHGLTPADHSIVLTELDTAQAVGMNQNVKLAWEILTTEYPDGASNQEWMDAFKARGGAERSFYRAKQHLIERLHVKAQAGVYRRRKSGSNSGS